MRIQKYFSQKGILSRRETEKYILNGWVKLNGKVVTDLGRQIDPEKDKLEITNQAKSAQNEKITVAVNKPRGIVSSKNKDEGETIFELLPQFENLNTVGRLDKESEGLILLSNDGTITSAVTGDDHKIEKEYVVGTQEVIIPNKLKKMAAGIKLEDGMTLPAVTELIKPHLFSLVLKEGRKHQIRRMADALQLTVVSLKRVRVGNILLDKIKPGKYRVLRPEEVQELKRLAR